MCDTDDIALWNAAAADYDARLVSGSFWRHQHVVTQQCANCLVRWRAKTFWTLGAGRDG
jgi:hypothetical protein